MSVPENYVDVPQHPQPKMPSTCSKCPIRSGCMYHYETVACKRKLARHFGRVR